MATRIVQCKWAQFYKRKTVLAEIGVNLRVGEDAESAGSPGPSLGNVDKDDDDTASPVGRDPRWRGIEGDGDGFEGAEAMEPLAGRCSGTQELRHGGGAHEVRPHRRLRRGAARAGAAPDRDVVHPDPDLVRREPTKNGLEAILLAATG